MSKDTEKEVLYAVYGDETFVKIKQVLGIGKMLFAFVNKNTKEHIDIYMSAEEFAALLMNDIRNGVLFKKIYDEKAKGAKYPASVWTSPFGGAEDGNGNCISRSFTIAPGSKAEIILTATQYPATKTDTGAFIPVKQSKPLITIRVPFTFNDFKILNYVWEYLAKDYFTQKYSVANMQAERYSSNDNANSNARSDAPASKNSAKNNADRNQQAKSNNTGNKPSGASQSNPETNNEIGKYYFKKNTCELQYMKNGYDQCIKAVDASGQEHIIIFPMQITEKEEKWKAFEEAATTGIISFTINAKKVRNNLHFCSFAG